MATDAENAVETAAENAVETAAAATPLTMTVDELAATLHLSRTVVYAQMSAGAIGPTPFRVGTARRVLFARDEVEAWIVAHCPMRHTWKTMPGEEGAP